MTFDEYCDKNQVRHLRESFYHHLMALGADPQSKAEFDEYFSKFIKDALTKTVVENAEE